MDNLRFIETAEVKAKRRDMELAILMKIIIVIQLIVSILLLILIIGR